MSQLRSAFQIRRVAAAQLPARRPHLFLQCGPRPQFSFGRSTFDIALAVEASKAKAADSDGLLRLCRRQQPREAMLVVVVTTSRKFPGSEYADQKCSKFHHNSRGNLMYVTVLYIFVSF